MRVLGSSVVSMAGLLRESHGVSSGTGTLGRGKESSEGRHSSNSSRFWR